MNTLSSLLNFIGNKIVEYDEELYKVIATDNLPSVQIASGTNWVNLGSFTIPKKGTYLLEVIAMYPSNGTGRRAVGISTSSGATPFAVAAQDIRNAVNGAATITRAWKMYEVEQDNETYYIVGYQNSGSSLSVTVRREFVRIGL